MGKYFTIKELTASSVAKRAGIRNVPNELEEENLVNLIDNILDPLREAYGSPIIVNSGFRCKDLNLLVKGSKTSQHMQGLAADIRSKKNTKEENKQLFDLIIELDLPFDQLIDESDYSWIHVSYSKTPRKQILKL